MIPAWFNPALNPHIPPAEWDKPIYFPTEPAANVKKWWSNHEAVVRSDFPFYGTTCSLYVGTHVGWTVNGKQYPRSAFTEHHFAGSFTGGAPVGLTPIQPLL